MFTLILTCAGRSARAGEDKILFNLNGKTVMENALIPFLSDKRIDRVIVTSSKNDFDAIAKILENYTQKPVTLILGGGTRHESVSKALSLVETDYVIIHDGARPYVDKDIIDASVDSALEYGSGVSAINSRDTVASAKDNRIVDIKGKEYLYLIQTPQSFNTAKLKNAFRHANKVYPDESSIWLDFVGQPALSQGKPKNIKLTFHEDLKQPYRTGIGFDCHRLAPDRPLILGGVKIPYDKGLVGHSDADVLLHAVIDAILSSLALPDIGQRFPDTDKKYKNADSALLLKDVLKELPAHGYELLNVSVAVMAEKPKLNPYAEQIRENVSGLLSLSPSAVGLSFTTTEKLGFAGREEGIGAYATAVITTA